MACRIIDRLDREAPDPATAWLDVELARLSTATRALRQGRYGPERSSAPRTLRAFAGDLARRDGSGASLPGRKRGLDTRGPLGASISPDEVAGAGQHATGLESGPDAFHARLARERSRVDRRVGPPPDELALAAESAWHRLPVLTGSPPASASSSRARRGGRDDGFPRGHEP